MTNQVATRKALRALTRALACPLIAPRERTLLNAARDDIEAGDLLDAQGWLAKLSYHATAIEVSCILDELAEA